MEVLTLPEVLDVDFLRRGPAPRGWIWKTSKAVLELRAKAGPPRHIEPMALAALSAWAFHARRSGCTLAVHASIQTPYTYRTGLLQALVTGPPWSDEVMAQREFFPLCAVAESRRVEALHEGVLKTLNITAPAAVKAVGNSISEIVRNADEHSRSEPTSFAAGWFRSQGRVSIGVADTGVGILRTLRRKRVATLDDDDQTAIEKAIQPHVTGAGKPGVSHAPKNHGIGLHTTRMFARDSGGEMVIISGKGIFIERHPAPTRFEAVDSAWQGTLVGVTIKPQQVGAFALGPLGAGLDATPSSHWPPQAPEGSQVLKPPVDGARFAANKDWYDQQRPRVIAAIEAGSPVHIDFGSAVYSTQSALHALLAEPIRIFGPQAMALLTYSHAGQPLRAAVALVTNYALGDHHQDQLGHKE